MSQIVEKMRQEIISRSCRFEEQTKDTKDEYNIEKKDFLRKNHYPEDKTHLVKKCILNHSKKRREYRNTTEEQILVDADGLSHFEAVNQIYSLARAVMGLSEEDSVRFVQDKLTADYDELSDGSKYLVKDKYGKVMAAKCAEDVLQC